MRKLFVSSLFLFALFMVAQAQQTVFVPVCTGSASADTAKFTTIKTTVGATNQATIKLPYKLTASQRCKVNDLSLTANITLDNTDGSGIAIVTGQMLTVLGPIVAPPKQLFFNATAGLGTVSFSGNTTIADAPPEWWGGGAAVAATTDTAAWVADNAALVTIGSGDILLGPGGYLLNGSGVTLGSNSVGAFTGIGMRGTNGAVGTTITYSGTGDGITVRNGRYNRLTDFSLVKSGAKGTSRGIVITGPGGGGAFTFFSEMERVTVSNFHIGVENGNTVSGADADLVDYRHVTLEGNDIGLKVTGANSTMIHAWDTSIGRSATYGVYLAAQGGGQVNWYGGSFGGNTISFYNDGTDANYNLQGIRDEYLNGGVGGTGYQFIRNEASFGTIKVSNYHIAGDGVTVPTYPVISNNGGVVQIIDSTFGAGADHLTPFGPGTAGAQVGGNTTLLMSGNTVNENVPLFSTNGNLAGMSYRLENNLKISDVGVYSDWDDERGVIDSVGAGARSVISKSTPTSASSSIVHQENFLTRLLATNVVAPPTPAAGFTELYVDSTTKTFKAKNDAGTLSTTVIADAGSANSFLTAMSAGGVFSKAQPTFSNLATGTAPAFTLGGTVSGGGNQVNNVIIGTTTPLAIIGTTITANTMFSGPHNGTLGATTPASAVVTTLSASGTTTPTGGIAAAGGFSISPRLIASCGTPAITATQGTDSTPVNTETYIVEIFIPANTTVTGVALLNGSAVAGNVKISLADSTGAPIAAAVTTSTAQAGTAVYQLIPFAVAYAAKGPATYYVLVQFNTNTTPRFRTHIVGVCGASKKTGETYGTFTSVTPPTTFTTALGPTVSLY